MFGGTVNLAQTIGQFGKWSFTHSVNVVITVISINRSIIVICNSRLCNRCSTTRQTTLAKYRAENHLLYCDYTAL